MDNAILSFTGLDRFDLAFDRKSNDPVRQISIAELLAGGSVQRAFLQRPRIGRSNRYDRGAWCGRGPAYFAQYYAALL
jgi:hypothetical protein